MSEVNIRGQLTQVDENGNITVLHPYVDASQDIVEGVLPIERGGTGARSSYEVRNVMINTIGYAKYDNSAWHSGIMTASDKSKLDKISTKSLYSIPYCKAGQPAAGIYHATGDTIEFVDGVQLILDSSSGMTIGPTLAYMGSKLAVKDSSENWNEKIIMYNGTKSVDMSDSEPLKLKKGKYLFKYSSYYDVVELIGRIPEPTESEGIMVGASSTKAGTSGLVPAPGSSQYTYFLRGDGTWAQVVDNDGNIVATPNVDSAAGTLAIQHGGTGETTVEGIKTLVGTNYSNQTTVNNLKRTLGINYYKTIGDDASDIEVDLNNYTDNGKYYFLQTLVDTGRIINAPPVNKYPLNIFSNGNLTTFYLFVLGVSKTHIKQIVYLHGSEGKTHIAFTRTGFGTTNNDVTTYTWSGWVQVLTDKDIPVNRKTDESIGTKSVSLGHNGTASGNYSVALGNTNTSSGENSTTSGSNNTASGIGSVALGTSNTVNGNYSIALGNHNIATGVSSTTTGSDNSTSGTGSVALGTGNTVEGDHSFSSGYQNNIAGSVSYSTTMGYQNKILTSGANNSCAIGYQNTVKNAQSFAMGKSNIINSASAIALGHNNILNRDSSNIGEDGVDAYCSAAIGYKNTLNGYTSYALGNNNTTYAQGSVAIGLFNTTGAENKSSGKYSIAMGQNNTTTGENSATIGKNNTVSRSSSIVLGSNNNCSAVTSFIAGNNNLIRNNETATTQTQFGYCSGTIGHGLINDSYTALVIGRYNLNNTNTQCTGSVHSGYAFKIGNGGSNNRSDAFRIDFNGKAYGSTYSANGADYAEFIKPWYDNNIENEDRVGYMVTIKDGYLHKANEGDYIIGITSGNPSVVGNGDEDYYWKYERDEFNRTIYHEIDEIIEEKDDDGNTVYTKTGKKITVPKVSSNYNPELQSSYVERSKRPEWSYVGMRGILPVRDDGTCEAGGFCKCGSNGIATRSERGLDTYYVIERINDHVISVEVK